MEEKVLVKVYIPATETAFDVFIPLMSKMSDVLELLKKAVTEMSRGLFTANETTAICWRGTGDILDINLTVFALGIHNGSKLMMV